MGNASTTIALADFKALRDWAVEELSRPAPTLLDQTRADFLDEVEGVAVKGSYSTRLSSNVEFNEAIEQIMRRGSRTLDDRKQLQAAVRAAVEGTSPSATSGDD